MQELPSPSHTPQSSILPLLQQRPAASNAPLHSLAQYISKKQRVIGIVTDCRWRGSVPLGGSGRGCRSLDSNVHLVRQPRLELDSSCRVYQGHQTHSISDDDPERRSNLPSVDSTLLCTPCSTCKRHSYTLPSLENPILLSVLNTGVLLEHRVDLQKSQGCRLQFEELDGLLLGHKASFTCSPVEETH